MQKFFYIICFVCLCILPVIGSEVCAGDMEAQIENKSPEEFIGNMVTSALEIVNEKGVSDDLKRNKLSQFINKYLDIERISKSVFSPLGYNGLSDEDKKMVQEFMKKYLLTFYAGEGKLTAMLDAKLSSDPVAEPKDKDFSVKTIFEKDSSSVEIDWITNGKKVFYVVIAGFNQITTLRSEMRSNIGSGTLMDYIKKQN